MAQHVRMDRKRHLCPGPDPSKQCVKRSSNEDAARCGALVRKWQILLQNDFESRSEEYFFNIAWAQAYPTRPVHLLEGFGAGSAPDIVARLIGQALSERLGQSFVIENRAGASSNIAAEAVVRAGRDHRMRMLLAAAH
jgi:hypothetical protein